MTGSAVGMPCPLCRVPLVMSERQGVEIDYCPQCRGVWLDRGELDKIIERTRVSEQPGRVTEIAPGTSYPRHGGQQPGYRKKRKSFFEELFD